MLHIRVFERREPKFGKGGDVICGCNFKSEGARGCHIDDGLGCRCLKPSCCVLLQPSEPRWKKKKKQAVEGGPRSKRGAVACLESQTGSFQHSTKGRLHCVRRVGTAHPAAIININELGIQWQRLRSIVLHGSTLITIWRGQYAFLAIAIQSLSTSLWSPSQLPFTVSVKDMDRKFRYDIILKPYRARK